MYSDPFYYLVARTRTPYRRANLIGDLVTVSKAVGRWRAILSLVLPRKSPTVQLKHLLGSYLPAVSKDREEKKKCPACGTFVKAASSD